MNNKRLSSKEMVAKSKNKVLSCSTPEHHLDSPSRDSDSICDSESASPVPFLCTQDGAEGETDVVWNFYTPKSETAKSRNKNTTPVSRRTKKTIRSITMDKPLTKRRHIKPTQKKTELFQELIELNQNLHEYLSTKTSNTTDGNKPYSEEDIFSDTSDSSPRSGVKSKNRCLRKNVLSSKFTKAEPDCGLESDDSMNEFLLKASQVAEEKVFNSKPKQPAKNLCPELITNLKPDLRLVINEDSMDAILDNIKLESPSVNRLKNCNSPRLNNDSFDNLLSNLNDSFIDRFSQKPIKNDLGIDSCNKKESNHMLKEMIVYEGSPSSKSVFGRHSSMPESPLVINSNKPSTSGMVFGRYSSMPFNKSDEKIAGDSPIRCTPDEIRKKHKQAREKLLAKRLLPFTATQQSTPHLLPSQIQPVAKKSNFQLRVPTYKTNLIADGNNPTQKLESNVNIKLIIEKKRQEALLKLRKRQPQSK